MINSCNISVEAILQEVAQRRTTSNAKHKSGTKAGATAKHNCETQL
ncbi:MAG: hypothetical protein HC849_24940 [Oscillatoriales cyanobacterium RU_3_3]|nr:hypothetical protein [Microcoleus sp. SU_5_6]NJL67146.1 hypothetical protein [Microcoleus sp. SM1_3_4]NJM62707.1 hypothetical protein [Oscillatoriales cyanobacterium RU_3_3]NJR24575.1 hypothetical protein [Richelia sp. CSU_2_1]